MEDRRAAGASWDWERCAGGRPCAPLQNCPGWWPLTHPHHPQTGKDAGVVGGGQALMGSPRSGWSLELCDLGEVTLSLSLNPYSGCWGHTTCLTGARGLEAVPSGSLQRQ